MAIPRLGVGDLGRGLGLGAANGLEAGSKGLKAGSKRLEGGIARGLGAGTARGFEAYTARGIQVGVSYALIVVSSVRMPMPSTKDPTKFATEINRAICINPSTTDRGANLIWVTEIVWVAETGQTAGFVRGVRIVIVDAANKPGLGNT